MPNRTFWRFAASTSFFSWYAVSITYCVQHGMSVIMLPVFVLITLSLYCSWHARSSTNRLGSQDSNFFSWQSSLQKYTVFSRSAWPLSRAHSTNLYILPASHFELPYCGADYSIILSLISAYGWLRSPSARIVLASSYRLCECGLSCEFEAGVARVLCFNA